jgi:surface antigen
VTALRFSRLLATVAICAGVLASPLASVPAAAACTHDPYNGVCVKPVTYHLRSTTSRVYVYRKARLHTAVRHLSPKGTARVICQINNGGAVPGHANHTWNAIAGGGWIYSANLRMPLAANGFTPGMRHCGAPASPPPAPPAPAPSPSAAGLNPAAYPWPRQDGWAGDGHGYWQGECVSFAAWAVRADGRAHLKSPDHLGNANKWTGSSVDARPRVGDVAQWDGGRNGAGSVGHVAYVAAVNANGTVTVWEYNWGNFHRFNTRTIAAGTPSRYLHF